MGAADKKLRPDAKDVTGTLEDMPVTQEKRRRVDELHSADFQWMREL